MRIEEKMDNWLLILRRKGGGEEEDELELLRDGNFVVEFPSFSPLHLWTEGYLL